MRRAVENFLMGFWFAFGAIWGVLLGLLSFFLFLTMIFPRSKKPPPAPPVPPVETGE